MPLNPNSLIWRICQPLLRARSARPAHQRLIKVLSCHRGDYQQQAASPTSIISTGYPGVIDYTASQSVPKALSLKGLDTPPTVALPPRVEHLLASAEGPVAALVAHALDLPSVCPSPAYQHTHILHPIQMSVHHPVGLPHTI